MSTAQFPSLPGLTYSVLRTPQWSTEIQQNISGKEVRIALWNFARYTWTLTFEFLRSDANAEFQTLFGFYSARQGSFDSFLYQDVEDNAVAGQLIGQGAGATPAFQLIRVFGGGTPEAVLAPNAVSAVYLNGTPLSQSGNWSVSNWGSATPGVLTFTSPPGDGVSITADFSYYFPCRFTDDTLEFENFMSKLWAQKKLSFISIK